MDDGSVSSESCNLLSHESLMNSLISYMFNKIMQLRSVVIQISVGNLISIWMLDLFCVFFRYSICSVL
jgi:hypothetical protein